MSSEISHHAQVLNLGVMASNSIFELTFELVLYELNFSNLACMNLVCSNLARLTKGNRVKADNLNRVGLV